MIVRLRPYNQDYIKSSMWCDLTPAAVFKKLHTSFEEGGHQLVMFHIQEINMNVFCRDETGAYQPVDPNQIIELGQRIISNRLQRNEDITATSPQDVQKFLQLKLAGKTREIFGCLFLDTRHRMIAFEMLFYGTVDGASVHPREVVKRSLELNAAAVIFAHNHPSGVAEPSQADIAITGRLKTALALIDVRVLDHLVVCPDECVSLAQRGHI